MAGRASTEKSQFEIVAEKRSGGNWSAVHRTTCTLRTIAVHHRFGRVWRTAKREQQKHLALERSPLYMNSFGLRCFETPFYQTITPWAHNLHTFYGRQNTINSSKFKFNYFMIYWKLVRNACSRPHARNSPSAINQRNGRDFGVQLTFSDARETYWVRRPFCSSTPVSSDLSDIWC